MKLELTNEQAAVLRPLIKFCQESLATPDIVIAQVMPGDWRAPEKTWLIYSTIKASTGRKIRQLIERDQEEGGAPKVQNEMESS